MFKNIELKELTDDELASLAILKKYNAFEFCALFGADDVNKITEVEINFWG